MNDKLRIATFTIQGTTPLMFGKMIDPEKFPRGEEESPRDYEDRTWRERVHTVGEEGPVCIPARAIKKMIDNTAKYQNERTHAGIGCGKTWARIFKLGIAVEDDAVLEPMTPKSDVIGLRRSATCVPRFAHTFPVFDKWQTTFKVLMLDNRIPNEKVEDYVRYGGVVNGLGMWRPQNGGSYGRFEITEVEWEDKSI